MPAVTVTGANAGVLTLSLDSARNAAVAQLLAGQITQAIAAGTVTPVESRQAVANPFGLSNPFYDFMSLNFPWLFQTVFRSFGQQIGAPPALAAGQGGEYVQVQSGAVTLPAGYNAYIGLANQMTVTASAGTGQAILASSGDLTFSAISASASGTVVTGGGDNRITIGPSNAGNWQILTGGGNDSIASLGSGGAVIDAGAGRNAITLGGGLSTVTLEGNDTLSAGSGAATVSAAANLRSLVYGGSGTLTFVGGTGSATVFGGSGAMTVQGGSGGGVFHGGTSGNNLLQTGSGSTTLFGGGSGDILRAIGAGADRLVAGAGSETLDASQATGSVTLVGGAGSTTMIGGAGADVFRFESSAGPGTDQVVGFQAGDRIDLSSYGSTASQSAIAGQVNANGSTMLRLSDGTTITLLDVASVSASNFVSPVPGGQTYGGFLSFGALQPFINPFAFHDFHW